MSGASMSGHVASLYRHPVKGFTPEKLDSADLAPGAFFPCDRLYAVENGPSGFDSEAPAYIFKSAFTVLMTLAEVAKVKTAYDEASGVLAVAAEGRPALRACLSDPDGREAFAAWLTDFLGEAVEGPLKVVSGPGHRFTDHPEGYASIVNLASVRDLERHIGRPVDPLRFRANLYVEGWPAWVENEAIDGEVVVGAARAKVFKSITRCAATGVDPASGERDMEIPRALLDHYGHVFCGVYVRVLEGGRVAQGDRAAL